MFGGNQNNTTIKPKKKNMVRNLLLYIISLVSDNPKEGFFGFLASFAISILPSYANVGVLAQVQPDNSLFAMDVLIKSIQIVAGLLGIVLSSIMIYINFPKVVEIFKKKKKKTK